MLVQRGLFYRCFNFYFKLEVVLIGGMFSNWCGVLAGVAFKAKNEWTNFVKFLTLITPIKIRAGHLYFVKTIAIYIFNLHNYSSHISNS